VWGCVGVGVCGGGGGGGVADVCWGGGGGGAGLVCLIRDLNNEMALA